MRQVSVWNSVVILVIALSVISTPAYAYLDPGTGSMAIQLLVAGLLGAVFTLKTWWRSFLALFSKTPKSTNSQTTEE